MNKLLLIFLFLIITILFIIANNFLLKNRVYDFFDNNEEKLINLDILPKIKKIYLWQGERQDNALQFMYKPVIISILEILEKEINNIIEIDYRFNNLNFDELEENDLLIWVGCENIPNFDILKKRNIYTIYYNTEPDFDQINTDEIWTYSKYLFDNYNKVHKNQIIKFVPIICEENVPVVPYHIEDDNIKLIFMGSLNYRPDKKDILMSKHLLKNNLEEVYNLWSDNDFNNFIKKKANIFLNLKKTNNIVLPSLRFNKLLSHKCIIISEHTNDIDEEFYKDIIYFCNVDEIEDVYKKLMNKTNIELQNEADEIYKKFYNRFNTSNVQKLIISR